MQTAYSHKLTAASMLYGREDSGKLGIWRKVAESVEQRPDPWGDRKIHELPLQKAVRHRFNPHTSTWCVDNGKLWAFADGEVNREGRCLRACSCHSELVLKELTMSD